MSGGSFNYNQHKFKEIADEIEQEQFSERTSYRTLGKEIKAIVKILNTAYELANAYDLLISGDDNKEGFKKKFDKIMKKFLPGKDECF